MVEKIKYKVGLTIMLLATNSVNAQDLGLASGGNKILAELVKAFPIIVGIAFIWVGWKALSEYNDTKDVLGALKIVGWFLLAVFFIVGAYRMLKTVSL